MTPEENLIAQAEAYLTGQLSLKDSHLFERRLVEPQVAAAFNTVLALDELLDEDIPVPETLAGDINASIQQQLANKEREESPYGEFVEEMKANVSFGRTLLVNALLFRPSKMF